MNASAAVGKYPVLLEAAGPASSGVRFGAAVAFSFLAALAAHVRIALPFTPVPMTGQTFVILYAGALLGSRCGSLAAALYILEGCAGLPVFAPGGALGAARLLGPTGGYLVGFIPAAWVAGKLAERGWDRSPLAAAAMIALGSAVVFAFGLLGLARFVPAQRLPASGLYPFLLGDAFKICLSAAALPGCRRLTEKLRSGDE